MEHSNILTVSIVSPQDLARLRRIHDIPSSIELVVPDRGETPKTVRTGYSIAYTPFFDACRLSFPIPPSLLTILADLGLAFPQMNPNFVHHALALLVRAAESRIPFGIEELHRMCSIKSNSSFLGSFYLSPRKTRSVFEDIPARDDRWKEKYFFFRINAHSVRSFDFSRLPTIWAPRVVVPINTGLDKVLIATLRNGDCSWPNFTRERIRRALGTDTPQLAVAPNLEIDPLNPPSINGPANFHQIPIGTSRREVPNATSSSTSHQPLIRKPSQGKMTRRPSAREAEKARKSRAQAESSEPVRTGEIRRAVSDALEPASRAYETPTGGLPADPSSKAISLSSRDSERTLRPKKQRVEDPAPDRRSNSSNGSGGTIPYGWTFNHTKGCPIADDPEGVTFIFRHFKPLGCVLPPVRDMAERAAYVKMMAAHGRGVLLVRLSRLSTSTLLYLRTSLTMPTSDELEEVKKTVFDLSSKVKNAEDKEKRLEAQLRSAKTVADSASRRADDLTEQVRELKEEVDARVRRAVREAKQEFAEKYLAIFHSLKDKWEQKKVEAAGAITALEEKARLVEKIPELAQKHADAEVSDFSLAKLDLSQISEASVRPMEIDPRTQVPLGLDQFGSNTAAGGGDELVDDSAVLMEKDGRENEPKE
ncbi:uncharacterized protein LOC112082034 [Eutrema salsugineum]|uniref:uncharacterized protein LOC112082034 n=1 Tax=Eutrema salsugineum TaxID=72664 RepID=UPI000CED7BB0|nr:uncharacterized protein LOC112082034 [Eutrema salsugineum]